MMMSLGLFAFSLSSAAYRDLQRQTAWRHAGSDRIGARAATQFLGPGNDTITLSGLIAPDLTGDPASLDTLRDMADRGQPWTLVDGNGNVHGAWVIESLQESRSLFLLTAAPGALNLSCSSSKWTGRTCERPQNTRLARHPRRPRSHRHTGPTSY